MNTFCQNQEKNHTIRDHIIVGPIIGQIVPPVLNIEARFDWYTTTEVIGQFAGFFKFMSLQYVRSIFQLDWGSCIQFE